MERPVFAEDLGSVELLVTRGRVGPKVLVGPSRDRVVRLETRGSVVLQGSVEDLVSVEVQAFVVVKDHVV